MGAQRARIRRVWRRILPDFPVPWRVPPGIWWILGNDAVSDDLFAGTFELDGGAVFAGLVKSGMTVVDIGAHAGLYSLIASKLVGDTGHVVSFEPSPRERGALMKLLKWNRCRNVRVEPVALGETDGEATLYI